MTRVAEAVDGAELCKTYDVGGQTYVQVWQGGVGVNVYRVEGTRRGEWCEVHYWTMSNEEGRAPEQWRIEAAMNEHAEEAQTRFEEGDF